MNRKLKALLVEKGVKQKDISDALGVSLPAVCQVLGGHTESRRVKEKTAELLGVNIETVNRLWKKAA